ncbi:hypothetical protein PQX77_005121 [Marasmius sp. AFHP31]|nr:hypothetical protein PQX77_005121 [Marasmius sp. AFHP31]
MWLLPRLKSNSNGSTETFHSTSTLCNDSEASDHPRDEKHCRSLKEKDEENVAPPSGESVDIDHMSKDHTKPSKEGNTVDPEIDIVPDGGFRAWLVIIGITLCTFTAFGFTSTWGVFQAYYEGTALQQASSTQIAWIGSVQYALIFTPSMVVGRLFDKGYFHSLFICFSATLILATVLVAECTLYWQFLVCQGFLTGLSIGVITAPTPALLSQWFKRRRALAFGITACGSAFGGTVFPIVIRAMLPKIGCV